MFQAQQFALLPQVCCARQSSFWKLLQSVCESFWETADALLKCSNIYEVFEGIKIVRKVFVNGIYQFSCVLNSIHLKINAHLRERKFCLRNIKIELMANSLNEKNPLKYTINIRIELSPQQNSHVYRVNHLIVENSENKLYVRNGNAV